MAKELEVSGKNIEEAVAIGLKQLNCTKDDVEIKVLDEGTKGLFGLMGAKPAKVLLTVNKNFSASERQEPIENKNFENKEAEEKEAGIEESSESSANEIEERLKNVDFALACKSAKENVSKIVSLMNINVKNVGVICNDDTINLDLSTDCGSLLIGKKGQTLNALEYVVQLILNNNPKTRVKINIDTERYRQKQHDRLKAAVNKAMDYVRRTKKVYRFDPMSSRSRKFIHTYLEKFGEFESFSEGEGRERKVGIRLIANN